jgi:single stranded DNA-binding protein
MSLRIVGVVNLTRDAEVRTTQKGAWINFGVAAKRKGVPEGMQDVDFFEATYFVKNPESKVVDYLKKGTPIYIDNAEMRADKYEKDGQNRTMHRIRLYSFDFINIPKRDDSAKEEEPEKTPYKAKNEEKFPGGSSDSKQPAESTESEPKVSEEEIPF